MDEIFSPGAPWHPVSEQLRSMRRVLIVVWSTLLGTVAALAVGLMLDWWWLSAIIAVVAVVVAVWAWLWAARNQRAWGYAENEDDLYVRSGVAWRRIVAVPYGRVQFVDVEAGPIERAYKIATVSLHTASSATSAQIPGVPAAEATRLRDRLTELGKTHGAGI